MEPRRRTVRKSSDKRLLDDRLSPKKADAEPKQNVILVLTLIILANFLCLLVLNGWEQNTPLVSDAFCDPSLLHKDAKSAISRAKSPNCRHELEKIACESMTADGIYPKYVPSFCQVQIRDQDLRDAYVGCFKDSFTQRLLEGPVNRRKATNSPKECVRYCAESGYDFAGVQYSFECFCGNSRIDVTSSSRLDELECNLPCPGDVNAFCGGYLTMNVYQSRFLPAVKLSEGKKKTSSVRVAYLFVVHGRSLRQILRLFKLVYNPSDYFYFHVDSRSGYLHRNLKKTLLEERFAGNVKVTDKRWATIWGGASLLKMMMGCMREMLALNWHFDYFINLSESDYILKPPSEFKEFLVQGYGRNYVKSHGRDIETFIRKQGLDRTFHECDNHMFRLGPRGLPHGITLDGGSDWVCLERSFVDYLLSDPDQLLHALLKIFNHTLLPAESFFHTTLKNSRFCSSYVNNNLRVTNWKRQLGCRCQHKAVVDWCGCSPNVFKPTDWKRILNSKSRSVYFARKFDPTLSQSILNDIDDWVFGQRDQHEHEARDKYWENIFHHLDDVEGGANFHLANLLAKHCLETFSIPEHELQVTQIHALYEHDRLASILIMLGHDRIVECRHDLVVSRAQSSTVKLTVSNGFDIKEQTFRNPLSVIGQHDKPQLLIEFNAESNLGEISGSVLWISPLGDLVASARNVKMNATAGFTFLPFPSSAESIIPRGIWTALVLMLDVMHEVDFLVVGSHHDKPAVVAEEASSGDKENAALSAVKMRKIAEKHHEESSIDQWIQAKFPANEVCNGEKACQSTTWSSLSPDPKSSVTEL